MVRATARNRRPASPRREHRRDSTPVRPPGGGIAPFVAIAVIAAGLSYAALAPSKPPPPMALVSTFVPEYRADYVAENIDKVARWVDEIMLFSIQPGPDGNIVYDPGLGKKGLRHAKRYKAAGIKSVIITVGGAGRSSGFSAVAANPEALRKFNRQLVSLCVKYDFDGVDVNWEGTHEGDPGNYIRMLQEMNVALHAAGRTLSASVHLWEALGPSGWAALDRVNVMAYDLPMSESHSGFADVKKSFSAFLATSGCPIEKVVLGMPAYGRRGNDVKTYAELMESRVVSAETDLQDGFNFNGAATIASKVIWARTQGLAGVFLWEAGQDTLTNENLSLLRAMRLAADSPIR